MTECKEDSCGCASGGEACDMKGGCCCGCGEGQGCDCGCGCASPCGFPCLAKEAHRELLKEKMKKVFESKIGAKMDKVAALAVETALAGMQRSMKEQQAKEEYQSKLMEIFRS